jgi:hypothetical protein
MRTSRRGGLTVAIAGAVLIGAVAAVAAPGANARAQSGGAAPLTLHLVEKGGDLKIIDNPPKAKHQFDFSAGDIVIVSRDIFTSAGRRTGSLRLTCIVTTATTQQCAGSEMLAGGMLELAGVSAPSPSTVVAVVGGTGRYSGARGSSVSTDRKTNTDIADQTVTLLP